MNFRVECPNCHTPLPETYFNRPDLQDCPGCNVPVTVELFPAFFRKIGVGKNAEVILIDGESSCFFHPQKKAVQPCDNCGRFLCALCDCELNSQHLCPACLEAGRDKGKIKTLDNRRTLHGNIALSLALYPLLIFYFTLITAPITLYIVIRHWNSPRSLVRGNRFIFITAGLIALAEIAGWVTFFAFLWYRHKP